MLILLLSFDVNSHQKGKMLYILSDFIMNYEFVCLLGLAVLAFGLCFFCFGVANHGVGSSLLVGSRSCQQFFHAYSKASCLVIMCLDLVYGLRNCQQFLNSYYICFCLGVDSVWQAKKLCKLNVHMASCLNFTLQMITAWPANTCEPKNIFWLKTPLHLDSSYFSLP